MFKPIVSVFALAVAAEEQGGYGAQANYDPYGAPQPAHYGPAPAPYDPYGPQPASAPHYGAPQYAAPIYANGQQYANSPYPPQNYHAYGHTEDFVEPVIPSLETPYPFTKFLDNSEEDRLNIPHLGDYHCFLTGAPWTKCGRSSLASYFLDQCMVFHHMMSKNVDGICGGKPPQPAPKPDQYNDYSYGHEEKAAPAAPVYDEYTGTGYGGAISEEYLTEKCFQHIYVHITTATVMCLTENMIRIKYIEHYAQHAATNPIQGPILYLKKLHAFIDEVVACPNNQPENYPNLWRDFQPSERLQYNPNAPYYVNDNEMVSMHQYTSGEASGLAAFTVGDQFLCSDVKFLNGTTYYELPNNHHYDPNNLGANCEGKSAAQAQLVDAAEELRECNSEFFSDEIGAASFASARASGGQYVTDMSLRSLYDAVHYVEAESTALRRPQSIAEIAVSNAGIHEQPILEGFGIMYYCAFYACKANNGGNLEDTCFPEFDAEEDWSINSLDTQWTSLKEDADKVNYCLEHEKYLSAHDVAEDGSVQDFKTALQRSYICMAETDVVNFHVSIFGANTGANYDAATALVYGRHLMDERCYEHERSTCVSNDKLYVLLESALDSLVTTCAANKEAHIEKKKLQSQYGYGRAAPAQQYGGYQAQPAQYGYRAPSQQHGGYAQPAPQYGPQPAQGGYAQPAGYNA